MSILPQPTTLITINPKERNDAFSGIPALGPCAFRIIQKYLSLGIGVHIKVAMDSIGSVNVRELLNSSNTILTHPRFDWPLFVYTDTSANILRGVLSQIQERTEW